jgi:AcrR family transcriptional regulator
VATRKKRAKSAVSASARLAEVAADAQRVARRERRRDRSRDEILEATRRVLLRSGIAATTLDAVAAEVGVSKTAIYYYFASKDALLFELVFRVTEERARAVHDQVASAHDGGDALRAIITETVRGFAARLDDFRLVFLHAQVAGPGAVRIEPSQFARLRPLNDLSYAGTAKLLAEQRKRRPSRARVEPRLMAFLAHVAALGLLTMKGMVENVDDPLLYSDEQLVDGLARIFEAAAAP